MILLRRELLLAFRHRHEMALPLMFFVLVVLLFPLALGPEINLLRKIAPATVWIAALLSAFLSLGLLFGDDYKDGQLDHFLLAPVPMPYFVCAKIMAHWFAAGLPILILTPILAIFLDIPFDIFTTLMLTLLLGTPIVSLIGSIGAALTINQQRRNPGLLPLLVIPFYVPVLIFSTLAIEQAHSVQNITAYISLLAAILVISSVLAPLACAASIKVVSE